GRVSTAELNRVHRELREARQPPSRNGKRLNLLYGSQVRTRPPRFRLHVIDPSLVTRDYGYWVENELRRRIALGGIPVSIDCAWRERQAKPGSGGGARRPPSAVGVEKVRA